MNVVPQTRRNVSLLSLKRHFGLISFISTYNYMIWATKKTRNAPNIITKGRKKVRNLNVKVYLKMHLPTLKYV